MPFELGVGNVKNCSLRECQTNSCVGFSVTSLLVNEIRLRDFISVLTKVPHLARLRRHGHTATRLQSIDLRTSLEFTSKAEDDPKQTFDRMCFARPKRQQMLTKMFVE
jgi:hypothetical protein